MTLEIALKATVLLGIATAVQAVIHRRASAEARHLVWTLAIAGLLALPVLTVSLPGWAVVTRTVPAERTEDAPAIRVIEPAPVAATSTPAAAVELAVPDSPVASPAVTRSWVQVVSILYVTGVLIMLIVMVMRWVSGTRLARQATELRDPEWRRLLDESAIDMGISRPVRLLRIRERSMPMALGVFRAAIVIPAVADTWDDNRRRAVIRHELAHVARYDCLTQTLAFAACAFYWFHPATWWVARRLRIERELACDDRVIAAGTEPREYAGHLLEIAYTFGNHRALALAVSMARPRQLERRMLAALDDERRRGVPAIRSRIAGAVVATMLLIPLSSATTTVVAAPAQAERTASTTTTTGTTWQVIESARAIARRAAAAFGVAQDRLPGTWEIRPTKTEGTVHLRIVEVNSSSGFNVPIQQLEGLTAAHLTGSGGPIQFRMRRDAGTFTFEGVIRSGVGAGTFSFAPDPNFAAELAKRGFARPSALEQYQMARHDIGFAFVDELTKQGYGKPASSELVRAGQHGVNVTYLRDMGALGYRLGSLAPLIELRDHGVTPDYVRQLGEQGYKGLSADALREARDHGVTPDYVRAMREAGYGSLPMEQLIKARDHGATPDFVRGLADAGYGKLPLDELIRVRDHGVTPEYVRELRQLGHTGSIDDLVRARDHGVTPDYVRGMRDAGYGSLTLDQLIKARDHGVTPGYARELKALGYDKIPIDDLISLRDHGVTPDRVRRANDRAGTRLPLDMIKRMY